MATPAIMDSTNLNQINKLYPRLQLASKKTSDTNDPPDSTKNISRNTLKTQRKRLTNLNNNEKQSQTDKRYFTQKSKTKYRQAQGMKIRT